MTVVGQNVRQALSTHGLHRNTIQLDLRATLSALYRQQIRGLSAFQSGPWPLASMMMLGRKENAFISSGEDADYRDC